jgi:hypothetical protein
VVLQGGKKEKRGKRDEARGKREVTLPGSAHFF